MKNITSFLIIIAFIIGCGTNKSGFSNTDNQTNTTSNDTIKIANEELEYEVIIIDPGFNSWIYSTARPRGYYSESFLESRNNIFILEWNNRVNQPSRYDPNLYEMRIDYNTNIHYGYEVNYLIYNYMIYFQTKYNQRLAGFVPRP